MFFGDYPISMRSRVGSRLPKFTTYETDLVKGSLDFVGINHYTTFYATNNKTGIIGFLLNDTVADSGAFTLRKLKLIFLFVNFRLNFVKRIYIYI